MTNEERQQLKKTKETAMKRRDELAKERMKIEKELVQQNRVIASLSEILEESPDMDIGLTDATLIVIRAAYPSGLLPTEVRDDLRSIGYDIDGFSNPMASLHQVLIRLVKKGQIKEVPGSACEDGKKRVIYQHPRSLQEAVRVAQMSEEAGFSLQRRKKKSD